MIQLTKKLNFLNRILRLSLRRRSPFLLLCEKKIIFSKNDIVLAD